MGEDSRRRCGELNFSEGAGYDSELQRLISDAAELLRQASDTPRLDAALLFMHVSGCSRIELITESRSLVDADLERTFQELVVRRSRGEPVAYLIGKKEFFGLTFEVTPAVLIPRPETEHLVDLALKRAANLPTPPELLDLGTGSGCIAVTIAHLLNAEGRGGRIVAVDQSAQALAVARRNAELHGAADRITFLEGSWYQPLRGARFDIILSNPPYIAEGDPDVGVETRFEPHSAIYSAEEGLADIRAVIEGAVAHLNPAGVVLLEIGWQQGEEVKKLAGPRFTVQIHRDLSGKERIAELMLR